MNQYWISRDTLDSPTHSHTHLKIWLSKPTRQIGHSMWRLPNDGDYFDAIKAKSHQLLNLPEIQPGDCWLVMDQICMSSYCKNQTKELLTKERIKSW